MEIPGRPGRNLVSVMISPIQVYPWISQNNDGHKDNSISYKEVHTTVMSIRISQFTGSALM